MSAKILAVTFALAAAVICVWHANVLEAQIIYDGLISFWTFDEADMEDGIVMDVIGNNNGTIRGDPEIVDGRIGDALQFDGADDYIDCGNDESLNLGTDDFTLEAWFQCANQTSSWPCIIEKGNPLCDGCPPGYALYWYTNRLRFALDGSAQLGDLDEISTDATPYMDKTWHQIVGVRDKDSIYLYLDSVQAASGLNNERNVNVASNLWIGYDTSFNGAIDEVKIYSRALSEDEIQRNYEATSHELVVEPGRRLVATWAGIRSVY